MKNLKKVLSLVLALAMALSLMTVAFAKDAEDFADYDKVSHKEAADVMVAVGVFNGVEGNNFAPQDTLTREMAAKIITYMMMGQTEADKLTTTIAPYADVAANRWSAGAIAWCTEQGILAGSNGKFNPTGKLNGLAFSKMLLTALGYDAEIEKLVGSSWAINAATLALQNDLDDGMENISLSANLTREQAAQMAFNAMKANLVRYANKGTNVTLSDGTSVVVGATPATTYAEGEHGVPRGDKMGNDGYAQFAEKYCKDLKKAGTTGDKFERPASEWIYKNDSIGTYADTADATYQGEVTKGTLYSLVGKSTADKTVITGATNGQYTLTQYIDGAQQTKTTATPSANLAVTDYLVSGSSATVNGTGNGATTEVYINSDKKTITVVTINTYAAKATADYSTANKKLSITDLGGHSLTQIKNDDFNVTGYDKDDYILYTYAKNAIQSITKAETVSGNVDSYTVGKNVTIAGTKYSYSAKVADTINDGAAAAYKINETATVVLDQQGNVIVVDELVADDDNYVYVTNVGYSDTRKTSVVADVTTPDGKESTVTLKKVNDSDDKDTMEDNTKDGWYTYSVSSNKYTLTSKTNLQKHAVAYGGETLVENGKIAINTTASTSVSDKGTAGKANSKTVFVIKDKDDDVTVYNGIAKVPTIKVKDSATKPVYAYYYNGTDGYAKYVYIDVAKNATIDDKGEASSDVFYILKQSDKVVAADDNEYYTLDVLKNGNVEKLDVEAASGNELVNAVGSLVTKVKTNSKGQGVSATVITSKDELNTAKYNKTFSNFTAVSYKNNVLSLGTAAADQLVLTDNAVFYVVVKSGDDLMNDKDASYEVQTMSAEQLDGYLNGRTIKGTVTGLTTDSDSDSYKTVYMTITASQEG